jgi:TRAP-type C4-dicarboxylate transport system permease small subunit
MQAFETVLNWVVKLLRLVGSLALVTIMMVTTVDVILMAFGHPILGAVDFVGLVAVVVLACAMPYTQAEKGHVGVDLLVQRMRPRSQAVLDAVTSSVSFVLFGLVAWQMWLYAGELHRKGEVSMTVHLRMDPYIYLVSICFWVLCLVLLADIIGFVAKAVKR